MQATSDRIVSINNLDFFVRRTTPKSWGFDRSPNIGTLAETRIQSFSRALP